MRRRSRVLLLALLLAAASTVALPTSRASGAEDAMLELLRVLRDNGTIDQKAYDLLRRQVIAERQAKPPSEGVAKEVKKEVESATKSWPEVDTKGKLEVRSRDGDFAFRLGGRVQVDAALYDNEDDSGLGSGSEFRRARLEVQGTVWRHWDFKLQYDFTDTGEEGLRDAFIRYTGFEPHGVTGITVGQFKEPFSLEELTSSKYITFMERALPNVFAPARSRGVGASVALADMVTGAAGFFGEGVDTDEVDGDDNSEGWGGTGRLVFSPLHTATRVVHLGTAGGFRTPDEADMIRFRQRPESHVTDVRLVNTDFFDADDFTRFGAEAAVVLGPVSLQAEYMRTHVNRQMPGASQIDLEGWYGYGSWFLTGESRPYEFEDGAFGNVKPKRVVGKGGIGAWELAARYSMLDLNDADIAGGKQQDVTFGLNWYPNSNLRLLLNYVQVLDVDGGPFDGVEPGAAQVRAQVHW